MQGRAVHFFEPIFGAGVKLCPDFAVTFQQSRKPKFYRRAFEVASVCDEAQLKITKFRREFLLNFTHTLADFREFLDNSGFAVARKTNIFQELVLGRNIFECFALGKFAGFIKNEKFAQFAFYSIDVNGNAFVTLLRTALAVCARKRTVVVGV